MSMDILSGAGVGQPEAPRVNVNTAATVAATSNATPEMKVNHQENGSDSYKEEGRDAYHPAESTVRDTVKKTNRKMDSTTCEFSYHEGTHMVSIKIKDKDTNEVIKEIPPEKSLEMLQKMWEMAGILVDEKR